MDSLRTLLRCVKGPRLFAFYKVPGHTLACPTPAVLQRSHRYIPSSLESISDNIIRVARIITSFGAYISPILFTYLFYKRNVPGTLANYILQYELLLRLFTTASTVLIASICVRGLARYSNAEYREFLRIVEESHVNPSVANTRLLVHFDADFSAFPVDYRWSESKDKRPPAPYKKSFPAQSEEAPCILDKFPLKWPLELVLAVVMKTIGRRIVYPGSLGILQSLMGPAITAGRQKLIEEQGGIRHKLESYDGNHIDTMFVDRRRSTPNGEYLVIGCEGNGGFYELGTILTPLEAGYSVLGWNHPGFGGSTGVPYPDQEVAAIDTVIRFAINKLNFATSQIVVFGWSIGGFTASWAGMRYPNLHGLVIDASFDHILPLARNILPGIFYPIVELAVREHFDLDNSRHFKHYQGPFLLIRRSQDEVISTNPYNSPPTNRANYLLIDILKNRFPTLIDDRAEELLIEYLSGDTRHQNSVLRKYSVKNNQCLKLLLDFFRTNKTSYPVNTGSDLDSTTRNQLVLYLASRHLVDYDSVHCSPLPARYFQRPWNLIGLALNDSNL